MATKTHTFTKRHYIEFLANQYAKEFGTPTPELAAVAPKYLAFKENTAGLNRAASEARLPFPVLKIGTKKSPYVVSVMDLAEHVYTQSVIAKKDHLNLIV